MRIKAAVIVAGLFLTGCAANRQQVAAQLGQEYIGQNADRLVAQFGPPTTTYRLSDGGNSLSWQLTNSTSVSGSYNNQGNYGAYGATAQTSHCKVFVTTNAGNIVQTLRTEDASGTGGIVGALGGDIRGSLCARFLGIPAPRS